MTITLKIWQKKQKRDDAGRDQNSPSTELETNGARVDNTTEREEKIEYIAIEKSLHILTKCTQAGGISSIGGVASELPNLPGLHIKKFIQLPVNDHIAKELMSAVDAGARNTYKLDSSSIEIKNPEWESGLNKLVDRIAKALGSTRKVEAKLNKLLLYKEGGYFEKHKDTEKMRNMFATLILQLPSIYEGGELIVHDKSGKKVDMTLAKSRAKHPI